jgi:NADP-dependent 3-hydroxy acid dehydrogenase YdfG
MNFQNKTAILTGAAAGMGDVTRSTMQRAGSDAIDGGRSI